MSRDRRLLTIAVYVISCCALVAQAHALGGPRYVTSTPAAGDLALVQHGTATPLLVSSSDWPGVIRAVGDLSDDVKRVTDLQPAVLQNAAQLRGPDVILIEFRCQAASGAGPPRSARRVRAEKRRDIGDRPIGSEDAAFTVRRSDRRSSHGLMISSGRVEARRPAD